ncbi:MAG: hypothetical protein JSS00_03645 [Proteobacteria bacterium]|nr:hypothetical protein [Pseudomonadota bacterium]
MGSLFRAFPLTVLPMFLYALVLCFTVALIAFLLSPPFGTNEFFLIMGMILVDFVASFIVMTISARRDVSFSQ